MKKRKKKKQLSFLERALKNVNETTLAIQNFAIQQQIKKEVDKDKPKNKKIKWCKTIIIYGSAILVGAFFGFFYGIMTLFLVGVIISLVSTKLDWN